MSARTILTAALLGTWPAAAAAQSLAARVAAAPDGDVRLAFAARPGIVGNGRNIIQWDCGPADRHCRQQVDGDLSDATDEDWRSPCDSGPVRVVLRVRHGTVTDVRVAVGGQGNLTRPATDLGTVPAPAAAQYLLSLARRSGGHVGGRAILAATLADSVTTWPDLLRLARDPDVPVDTRRSAVFWVSQAAEQAATRGLDALVTEDTVDREIREQAIFALSQRPREEGVPALIRIARTHADRDIRRRAIFWLGQSNDPRALALFEELLTRP